MDLLIFDFDGLILDTETAAFQTWTEIYKSHGTELPLSEWAVCIGTSNHAFDVYAHLESRVGRALDREELKQRYGKRTKELVRDLKPRPGVVEYLNEAYQQRIALALASSSHQDWVMDHLSRLDLADRFHSIRCADDVEHVKPHPELYQLTLTTMGVKPHRALAFEDSPNGVKAAKAAGVFCVAVPNSVTRNLPLDHADDRLESMADISLRDLLHRVETRREAETRTS
jgi:HAD superfamily hydrolase (TIGR01509 family)